MSLLVVLFDLDGTLIDSSPGIRRCVDESLAFHELAPITDAQFAEFIGPPLTDSFGGLASDPSMVPSLIAVYREHYGAGGMYEYSVYDGVPELLDRLVARGYRLGVATSKVGRYARPVVDHAGLSDRFGVVSGAESDGPGAAKPVVMTAAIEALGVEDPATVVMIGDRAHDGQGASALGTHFIGVSWGFARPGELHGAGASVVVSHPEQLDEAIASLV